MDGISAMDTGNNGQMLSMNTEAVAEVKVLTSAYQAEYGRSSGIQVLSITKGGTNQFRGSFYDIERHSQWNKNSWANIQNGTPLAKSDQRDWGYSIGGPVGKPGGNNRLFFFYSHEFRPRTSGNVEYLIRTPTALERQGNFSQSRDNLGNLYPYIRDYTTGLPCSAGSTAGCFQYQGVLGWIPPD
ncbi:MAG: TonB-dependent Receptor Plug Domain protein, partial [Gemmatimonadetes bacterium]|nr:TonB-dependent Receptor Plug Domain protein [Gemmatimonadota bacterium]